VGGAFEGLQNMCLLGSLEAAGFLLQYRRLG